MQTTTRSAGQAAARKSNGNGPKSSGKKKKTQPKSNGKEGPAGPRPVAPPPVSGPWGNPKPAASSAPPPGFAPSPPNSTNVGFSDAHQRLLRHRALFAFRYLVGKAVELQLVASEERYAGILDCVDPDDFSVVLKSAKRLSSGADAKPFEDGSTVIFRRHQLAHLVADGTVNYSDGGLASGASAAGGFRTDTEISGLKGEHLFGRELETASSWLDPTLDTGALEDSGSNGRRHSKNQGKAGWNQFEANEKLFGVVSTYDENIYTTKLDKSKISTEQSRAAEKLAQEIERQSAAGNFHLQEERGQTVRGGKHANDLDEEARYSSVDRRPAPCGGNTYVPPAMRNAQRQSSGGKSQATATKTTPRDSVAAPVPPASQPATAAGATAAPPVTPATPNPLSFSEAVTGRSAATATPTAAPKDASKSQPNEKQEASGSPKKAALPAQVNGKDVKPAATKSKGSPKKKDSASEKEKKSDGKAESKTENKSSSSTTTTTTITTKQSKEEVPKAAPTKGLNPNAKEFKLNASAAEFTPSFAMSPAVKEQVSSPYRGGSPGHMPYPHPGMGYPPPMQEEWMYDGGMGGEEGGEMGIPPYGYGVPMGPNGVPMMYPPMMPQQNMRMMGGQRGYGGYQQQGYNNRGYYSPPNGGYPPYASGPGMPGGVGPQPPLPPTPSGDETTDGAPVNGAPAPPVPETSPEVESVPSSSKQQSSTSKKK